jgi:predicted enzyme related to lactoylglutathione lyase
MKTNSAPIPPEVVKFVLWAADMQRAVSFYQQLFGLPVLMRSPHWSEFTLGATRLALHARGDGSPSATGLSFQVSDIGAACRRAVELSGRIIELPLARPGEPIVLARVADTEGNEFMLTEWRHDPHAES